jgi:hypothetical protein
MRLMPMIGMGLILVGCSSVTPSPPTYETTPAVVAIPWAADAAPPLVTGVRLGDSFDRVREVFGPNIEERSIVADHLEFVYPPLGLSITATGDQGIAVIALMTTDAPALWGVRVGDSASELRQRWGAPERSTGARAIYRADTWAVLIMVDTVHQTVANMSIGWLPLHQRR